MLFPQRQPTRKQSVQSKLATCRVYYGTGLAINKSVQLCAAAGRCASISSFQAAVGIKIYVRLVFPLFPYRGQRATFQNRKHLSEEKREALEFSTARYIHDNIQTRLRQRQPPQESTPQSRWYKQLWTGSNTLNISSVAPHQSTSAY